jgi:flavin-dependent dehydrogenase
VEVDVAVIGAGPAGSAAAALLASRGVATALIDRDTFPRDKLCGEFLSYDSQPVVDLLGLIDRLAAFPVIDRCRVVGTKRSYEFPFPRPAHGVSRLQFDDLLLRRAAALGATVIDGWTAAGLQQDSGRWSIRISRDGEERVVRARVIVGAWGRWGRFDRQMERGFVEDQTHRHFGFKRHFRGPSTGGAIELYSYGRGYLGVSPIEGDLTNICGLVHASRIAGMKGGWDSFIAEIRREHPNLEQLFSAREPAQEGFLSSEPVIFRPRSPVERGVFMVGDASGIVDPLTGNGMAMALQGALVLAPFILRELSAPGSAAAAYSAAHAEFFNARIGWSRRISLLLGRPRLLDGALVLSSWRSAGRFLLERTRADEARLAAAVQNWERA